MSIIQANMELCVGRGRGAYVIASMHEVSEGKITFCIEKKFVDRQFWGSVFEGARSSAADVILITTSFKGQSPHCILRGQ